MALDRWRLGTPRAPPARRLRISDCYRFLATGRCGVFWSGWLAVAHTPSVAARARGLAPVSAWRGCPSACGCGATADYDVASPGRGGGEIPCPSIRRRHPQQLRWLDLEHRSELIDYLAPPQITRAIPPTLLVGKVTPAGAQLAVVVASIEAVPLNVTLSARRRRQDAP
jgi:hypothetical protein